LRFFDDGTLIAYFAAPKARASNHSRVTSRGSSMNARRFIALFALLFLATFLARPVNAIAIPFVLNFDENGNGMISIDGGPFQTLNGALLPDPSNGIPALTFLLPLGVVGGDIAIREGVGGPIGDLLRFTNNEGGVSANRMIFYSLTGGSALADTGFPANANLSVVGATEDADGRFQFAPTSGMAGGVTNTYNGLSAEGVPEPSSLALFAVCGLALGGWRRWTGRRQRKAT
jgi:hypothetical protein